MPNKQVLTTKLDLSGSGRIPILSLSTMSALLLAVHKDVRVPSLVITTRTSVWNSNASCCEPISLQSVASSLLFTGRDLMWFTILIAHFKTLLSSESSVLLARDSRCMMQCVNFTWGATSKTFALSPLFLPTIAPAPSVHTPTQLSHESSISFILVSSLVKMSLPVQVPSSAEQKEHILMQFSIKCVFDERQQLSRIRHISRFVNLQCIFFSIYPINQLTLNVFCDIMYTASDCVIRQRDSHELICYFLTMHGPTHSHSSGLYQGFPDCVGLFGLRDQVRHLIRCLQSIISNFGLLCDHVFLTL